jgi:enterochelin esterase-like enzyme
MRQTSPNKSGGPNAKTTLAFGIGVIGWLALVLAAGCGKKPSAASLPPMAPSFDQLAASRLYAFATRLKAMPPSRRPAAAGQFLHENPATPLIESENLVGLFWYGKAQAVSIRGDLQGAWAEAQPLDKIPCGEDSFFYGLYLAPPDARLDYLLTVDGKEATDPRNSHVTPSGFGPHSEIAMPKFKPTPARRFRESIAHGTVDRLSFTNNPQPLKPRTLRVYKPPAYDGSARLPALYVYDGLEALAYMQYTNVLDSLIADGRIRPVLVVFVEMLPEDIELFPDKFPALATMVCNGIVPLIDRAYQTLPAPSSRGITGISVWGHLALSTALNRPDVFLMAAGQSTTVNEQLVVGVRRSVLPQASPLAKLYLDVGNYDLTGGAMRSLSFLKANQVLRDELQRRGINPRYQAYNDGHQWANWRERTDAILCYFFPPGNN